MAIGYDGGSYSGNLDEISRALGIEPDIEGVTSRLGTPVDRLGDATILGSAGMPLEGGLTLAQSLASLARIDPQLVRDIMSERTYMSGTGLLGEGDVEIHQDEEASDVKKAIDELDKSLENILPDTPLGTTDIFNAKTKMWEAVYDQLDRPSETSFVDTQVTDIGDDILSGTQSFEVETPLGTTDIFDTETGEWTALTDTEKAIEATALPWVDDEDELIAQKELDELIALNPTGRFRSTIDTTAQDTPTYSWPDIPSIQDTQANVMDEGILAGLGMTADQSHALTREINRERVGGRAPYPHEIEARKQGALINPLTSRYAQTGQNLEKLEEESNLVNQSHQQQSGFLEGLSQAMRNVLNDDPELMAQYMAARNDIIAQLNKTGYKEHEEFYPGSQAAATQAGFWGPKALGWNDKYNEYKDAQRELMGLQSGQRFMSDDWINNLGWMTPAQINQVTGYGES